MLNRSSKTVPDETHTLSLVSPFSRRRTRSRLKCLSASKPCALTLCALESCCRCSKGTDEKKARPDKIHQGASEGTRQVYLETVGFLSLLPSKDEARIDCGFRSRFGASAFGSFRALEGV